MGSGEWEQGSGEWGAELALRTDSRGNGTRYGVSMNEYGRIVKHGTVNGFSQSNQPVRNVREEGRWQARQGKVGIPHVVLTSM